MDTMLQNSIAKSLGYLPYETAAFKSDSGDLSLKIGIFAASILKTFTVTVHEYLD